MKVDRFNFMAETDSCISYGEAVISTSLIGRILVKLLIKRGKMGLYYRFNNL
jgi:hypothetical protein